MRDSVELLLPDSFVHPLFYPKTTTIQFNKRISFEEEFEKNYFVFDIAATLLSLDEFNAPWINTKETIPIVFKKWEHQKKGIGSSFQNRDRASAKIPMIRSLSYFISCLNWVNEKPVCSLQNINEMIVRLKYKPINVAERLSFITDNPDHYHSFIQLSQLFEEFEKQFYKIESLKKVSPNHPN
ncbi:GTPase [Cytobacillus suaedae]|nr:GTPase [Cytobacillus suaedae]